VFGDGVALEQADLDALGVAIIGTGQDDTLRTKQNKRGQRRILFNGQAHAVM